MLDEAKEYLARGWAPIPIRPRGKAPLVKDWSRFSDDLPAEKMLEEWFTRYPNANLGLVCGPAPGLLVLDIDAKSGGWESIREKGLSDIQTPKVRTGSGGGHVYFKYPGENGTFKNRAGILPGVDVRGHGGQVVAPPSTHECGKEYRWRESPDTPLADAPEWLMELKTEIIIPQYSTEGSEGLSRQTLEYLALGASEGERNDRLFKAASDTAGFGFSLEEAQARLLPVALSSGITEKEALETIKSGFSKPRTSARAYHTPAPVPTVTPPETQVAEPFDLNLPETVWRGVLADYRAMLVTTTEASDAYHLFTFLACVGSVLGRRAFIQYALPLFGNLYVCLVGRTGQDRKSTSLRHSERIVRLVDDIWRILRGLSSAEGLLAQIADPWTKENAKGDVVAQGGTDDKRLMVWLGEFSSLLRKAKQDRVANIVPMLTEAYDCPPDLHLPTKADPITVTEPYISLICASTPSWLEDLQDRDVLGGFANRFVFILGPAKDPIPFPDPPDTDLQDKIVSHLQDVMAWLPESFEVTLTDPARDLWAEFYTRWHSTKWPDELFSAIVQRIPDLVMKVALIYTVLEKGLQINVERLTAAIDVGGYAVASAQRIFADFHTSRESKLEKRILDVLEAGAMKFGDLHRAVGGRYSTLELNRALDALFQSGQTWKHAQGHTVVYGIPESE